MKPRMHAILWYETRYDELSEKAQQGDAEALHAANHLLTAWNAEAKRQGSVRDHPVGPVCRCSSCAEYFRRAVRP